MYVITVKVIRGRLRRDQRRISLRRVRVNLDVRIRLTQRTSPRTRLRKRAVPVGRIQTELKEANDRTDNGLT